jgi:hypothetical protein
MPYEIPKLGRHYLEVWAEEERNLLPQTPDELESRRDDHMEIDGPPKFHDGDDEQRSANFIVDRLLAAFLEYPEVANLNFLNQSDEPQVNGQNGQNGHYEKEVEQDRDRFQMDERLKRELQALDLMDENDVSNIDAIYKNLTLICYFISSTVFMICMLFLFIGAMGRTRR